jgi:hypothetical protein
MIAAHLSHVPHISSTSTVSEMLRIQAARALGTSVAALNWLRQALCGVSGHAMVLHFESTRLSLQCTSCGRMTAGWAIQDQP